ncbi:nicotinate-nucleotide adenylyltransferase [Massilia glaciei]|uniref:nicotinate-nucleotide adenylyltransferase n=1 Tax=Massilia glaciei TaxID=1524097 RepID=UPI0011B22145|nr:nicotinate-nucleotide adenylyltransferase [Massilia glaciei]
MKLSVATVHGRFQPPHRDHLEYMLAASIFTKHLIIGITQPDSDDLTDCPEDPHRAEPSANPLTYSERCEAIAQMLLAAGLLSQQFSFVRFPIEVPDDLHRALSTDVVCFTTIRDEWNLVKVDRLRALGYDVRVLWDRRNEPGIRGTEIRRKMKNGDDSWVLEVPDAVATFLRDSSILGRLQTHKK